MKVTVIESCIDLNTMRIEELVGAIQFYFIKTIFFLQIDFLNIKNIFKYFKHTPK